MSTLAWYYSRKLHAIKDLTVIESNDILDFSEYWYHLGFDFVDGSRLVFDILGHEAEIIDVDLDENQKAVIANLVRSKQA